MRSTWTGEICPGKRAGSPVVAAAPDRRRPPPPSRFRVAPEARPQATWASNGLLCLTTAQEIAYRELMKEVLNFIAAKGFNEFGKPISGHELEMRHCIYIAFKGRERVFPSNEVRTMIHSMWVVVSFSK